MKKTILENFSLEGKKAIVTGGAKGLCNGMANALHEAGAEVLLLDVLDLVFDSAREMGQTGAPAHAVKGDLSDFDHLESVYEECLEKLGGRVDILLNGAGIQYRCPAADFPHDRWQKIIDINLTAVFYLSQLAGKTMREQKYGKIINIAEQCHFSGLMLITAQSEAIAQKLDETPLPKVLVNRVLPHYTGDSVLTDNFQAGYEAALHLITLGHKEIGFIKGPKGSSASAQRFEGYLQAMKNYGLSVKDEFIWTSDLKLPTGKEIALDFLHLEKRPSAIVSVNDMTTLGFIDGCKKAGLSIPDDLSVVSFDDIPFASLYDNKLTTISQHDEEMGHIAAELMLNRLQNPDSKPERVILKPLLINRDTTKPYTVPGHTE